jgi:lipoprotein signal peptidase
MVKDMTRSRVIQVWFVAVALVFVAGAAFGAVATVGTWVLLLTLSLVPPAIVLLLWPGAQPPTAAEVLHDVDRRPDA